MKSFLTQAKTTLVRLYRDERGAEGFEKILIIGAIVLPILGILLFFKDDITEWLQAIWGDVKADTGDYQGSGDPF